MPLASILKSTTNHGGSEISRIDYLDGWRGMAILLVLMDHFFDVNFINTGRMGVDVFFVLSGMLMSNILFVKKVPLQSFYKRRVSRILPVFFIFITTISLSSLLLDLSKEHNNYIFNLLFLRAYYPETPNLWSTGLPVGHLWSLNIEEHSYIILSLITLTTAAIKRTYIPILLLGAISLILKYLYSKFPELAPADNFLRTEVNASFIMISAGYFLIKNKFEKLIPSWAPIASILLAGLCYSDYSPHWTLEWLMAPFLLAFSVNHLNLIPNFIKTGLSYLPLRLLGIWSFSIYLWQHPFYYYGTKFGDAFEFAGTILFFISIFIGACSFYFIENPSRRYLNDKW